MPATGSSSLDAAAERLFRLLQRSGQRIVFAESCTAGLVAAALARFPGVSEYLCGSAVTYRDATKARWLSVPRDLLDAPDIGAVSAQVAEAMCHGVLNATPEADVAASVTGHLGPHSPPGLDGVVFTGLLFRGAGSARISRLELPGGSKDETQQRRDRQLLAAEKLIRSVADAIES